MEKDFLSHKYLSDNERYADLINGFLFHGKQLVLPENLMEMVESDSTYHELADDAFDVISAFTNTVELTNKQKFHVKENKYDMCKAIKELIEDGRMEGRTQGYNNMKINLIYKKIQKGKTLDRIADEMECEIDEIRPLYDLVKAAGKDCDLEEICKRVSAGL